MKAFRHRLYGLAIGFTCATGGVAQAEDLKMASLGAASPTTVFSIAVSTVLKQEHDYNVQLQTGSAATRQVVEAASNELDLFVSAVAINHYLQNQLAMYKDMAQAPELAQNIRGLVNYPLGAYHGVVWADSGIETMEDIKGKKVFIGPPTGAARNIVAGVIEGVTGFVANEDYETENLDWSSAEQAFQDRQIDVYFVPTPIPSTELTQLSVLGEFRVLGIPEDAKGSEGISKVTGVPGRGFDVLSPSTYDNLVNAEPVTMISSIVGLSTNKWMSDEVAYNITKSILENTDALAASAPWMGKINAENALTLMNTPLHAGAYRYYQEIGVDVPAALVPPEAQ